MPGGATVRSTVVAKLGDQVNHGNLEKGLNFKNMLKLFCIDSGWITVEGRSETIGKGELPCILSVISGAV